MYKMSKEGKASISEHVQAIKGICEDEGCDFAEVMKDAIGDDDQGDDADEAAESVSDEMGEDAEDGDEGSDKANKIRLVVAALRKKNAAGE